MDDDLTPEQEHEVMVRLEAIRGCLVAAMELCALIDGIGEGAGLILDIAKAHNTAVAVLEDFKADVK